MSQPQAKKLRWIAVSYGVLAAIWLLVIVMLLDTAGWRIDKPFIDNLGDLVLLLLCAALINGGLALGAWKFAAMSQRWRVVVVCVAAIPAVLCAGNVAKALWLLSQVPQIFSSDSPKDVSVSAVCGNVLLMIALAMNAIELARTYRNLRINRP